MRIFVIVVSMIFLGQAIYRIVLLASDDFKPITLSRDVLGMQVIMTVALFIWGLVLLIGSE